MRRLIYRLGICCLAAAGRLPGRRRIGALLGLLACALMRRRRHIALVNISLTQPALPEEARRRLLRRHFIALGEWLMDTLWALSASREEIKRYVTLEGDVARGGCILLTPHFLGLELLLLRLNLHFPEPMAYYYKPMHSGFWNALLLHLRGRFGGAGFSTASRHSLLAGARYCRGGGVLGYLPDIDPRARKSTVYVPFMAVSEAATTTGVSRLAKAAQRPVVPCFVNRTAQGYSCSLLPPLDGADGDDDTAAAARMNALIGEWVEKMPENYFWLHRRFKTPAGGGAGVYNV